MSRVAPETARRAKRVEVAVRSRLLRYGAEPVELELCDLSFYGFKARAETAPRLGEVVKLDLPHLGFVRAKITWAREGYFGGAFATAVDVRKCLAPAASSTSGSSAPGRAPRAPSEGAARNGAIAAVQQIK